MTRAVLLALLLVASLGADAETWRYDVYNDLMSPYCPGRSLNDCPSPQAAELRQWIANQEVAGRDRSDVEAELYRIYGDVLRSAPRAEGWGLAAYVIPVLTFVVGGVLVTVFLKRHSSRAAVDGPPATAGPVDPELERLLNEELES